MDPGECSKRIIMALPELCPGARVPELVLGLIIALGGFAGLNLRDDADWEAALADTLRLVEENFRSAVGYRPEQTKGGLN